MDARMSRTIFQHYLNMPDLDWICATCALPPVPSDTFFANDSIEESEMNQPTQEFQENDNICGANFGNGLFRKSQFLSYLRWSFPF